MIYKSFKKIMKENNYFLLFNTDRRLAGDPAGNIEILPRGEVRIGRCPPEIWTGRPRQLQQLQTWLPYRPACRPRCQLCPFAQ